MYEPQEKLTKRQYGYLLRIFNGKTYLHHFKRTPPDELLAIMQDLERRGYVRLWREKAHYRVDLTPLGRTRLSGRTDREVGNSCLCSSTVIELPEEYRDKYDATVETRCAEHSYSTYLRSFDRVIEKSTGELVGNGYWQKVIVEHQGGTW